LSMFNYFLDKNSLLDTSASSDVIISTKVQLQRNSAEAPFTSAALRSELQVIKDSANKFYNDYFSIKDCEFIFADNISHDDRLLIKERFYHRDDYAFSENSCYIFNKRLRYEIAVNETEHFTIKSFSYGKGVEAAYKIADNLDDKLNKFCPYAFSEKFGYLTSEISGCGTALKIEVVCHLPFISLSGNMTDLKKLFYESDMSLKPVFSEKNKSAFYKISNIKTIGSSECEIIETFDDFITLAENMETNEREILFEKDKSIIEDLIFRSFGILKFSRTMGYYEALEHLSRLRWGVILFLIKDISLEKIYLLMINIQTVHLGRLLDKKFDNLEEIEFARSEYLRNNL